MPITTILIDILTQHKKEREILQIEFLKHQSPAPNIIFKTPDLSLELTNVSYKVITIFVKRVFACSSQEVPVDFDFIFPLNFYYP